MTQSLKQEANRLGFALTGCCPAVTPSGYSNFLSWLDAGYAGEMQYLEQRKSAYQHPESVMAETKSLLMLGMHYRTAKRPPLAAGQGKVASYAWGSVDYHDLIHQRLKQLKKFALELSPEISVRGVVDTAPLLEREFAQLAGIGWVGKNTLLLNKHNGSFFFLAALLLSVELEYDQPITTDHCGTCTACLDACPTDAFVQPFVLDATRCISYLTIEHRSPIATDLRGQLDGWILGCDVCQDVCPWNRKAPYSAEVGLEPNEGQNPIELRQLFGLSDDDFRSRFRKTPLWRPKRRGILRNAALALAVDPVTENLPALELGLNDSEPLVRGASAWSLGKHLGDRPQNLLRERQYKETDPVVRLELESALTKRA